MKYTIYLDFDGTMVEHAYPKIGMPNPDALSVVQKLKDAGHKIVLNTYRADVKDGSLEHSLAYLAYNNVSIDDVLDNKLLPPKWCFELFKSKGHIYIDDVSLNVPLRKAVKDGGDMVDWRVVDKLFVENGIY